MESQLFFSQSRTAGRGSSFRADKDKTSVETVERCRLSWVLMLSSFGGSDESRAGSSHRAWLLAQ